MRETEKGVQVYRESTLYPLLELELDQLEAQWQGEGVLPNYWVDIRAAIMNLSCRASQALEGQPAMTVPVFDETMTVPINHELSSKLIFWYMQGLVCLVTYMQNFNLAVPEMTETLEQLSDEVLTSAKLAILTKLVAATHESQILPGRKNWFSDEELLKSLQECALASYMVAYRHKIKRPSANPLEGCQSEKQGLVFPMLGFLLKLDIQFQSPQWFYACCKNMMLSGLLLSSTFLSGFLISGQWVAPEYTAYSALFWLLLTTGGFYWIKFHCLKQPMF